MPLGRRSVLPALALALILAGCGSSSYQDSARGATDKMRQIIETYNGARPHDVASTGAACQTAYDDLGSQARYLQTSTPPSKYKREAAQLRAAYREARTAFHQCAVAAQQMDFPAMAQASTQIQAADSAISRARKLEH